jgi:hypothetical protein
MFTMLQDDDDDGDDGGGGGGRLGFGFGSQFLQDNSRYNVHNQLEHSLF